MVKNTPNYQNIQTYNFYPSIQGQSFGAVFRQESLDEYTLNGTILNYSRISQGNRAQLFAWLSQECSRLKINRYAFALTCSYMDLYFMKKNDKNQVNIQNYQSFALGALILATKQIQIQGKLPIIDLRLFKLEQLLDMEKKIVLGLNFYLNPPNYIELVNNIAKLWDIKCQKREIQSTIRYFDENKETYLRLKALYQKIDCLYLFKKMLDFNLTDVVITLFYLQTKVFTLKSNGSQINILNQNLLWCQQPQRQDHFHKLFQQFLKVSQIKIKPNKALEKLILLFFNQSFPIDDKIQVSGRTFMQLVSVQTFNKHCLEFYKKHQVQVNNF